MEKLAIGPGYPIDTVTLAMSPVERVQALARAKGCVPADITVCILERPRHEDLIRDVRSTGAAIRLITDGDVAGVIHCAEAEKTGIDMYMGSGGAPEGVLAAAALRCIGGQMQGRLMFEDDSQIARAREMGMTDPHKVLSILDMAKGDVMFAASGVTTGAMLKGVRRFGHGAMTHSVVMRSKSGTVRYIEAHHNFATKTWTAR
jgi:fructose-1,6-bisphosphatase II / sedoheptulose-1,7-bisphosphatase